jgi:hypothetical protein
MLSAFISPIAKVMGEYGGAGRGPRGVAGRNVCSLRRRARKDGDRR